MSPLIIIPISCAYEDYIIMIINFSGGQSFVRPAVLYGTNVLITAWKSNAVMAI
ncbi:hypothetical protein SAMN05444064_12134 [Pseudomonas syringae]|nr:hypothetical protein SAMN05444514_12134 [Pseudomonas syringae]SFM57335.1 hypothetical protein SAMN05444064_12134 [Pseudomonas syringae]